MSKKEKPKFITVNKAAEATGVSYYHFRKYLSKNPEFLKMIGRRRFILSQSLGMRLPKRIEENERTDQKKQNNKPAKDSKD